MYYNLYDPSTLPAPTGAPEIPCAATAAYAPAAPARKQRRSRKARTLFSASLLSMLLLGFGGGMTAFATDDADSRMPLVVEYEEVFSAEPAEPAFEAGSDVETILDDDVPMAASPFGNDEAVADSSFEGAAETPAAPDQTSLAGAPTDDAPIGILAEVSLSPSMLDINGTRVPYVRSIFAPSCPNNNAALWAGDDSTTDGSYGYFVGHNPGDFACVYNLNIGDRVTMCNAHGDTRDYYVTRTFVVPSTTYFEQLGTDMVPNSESVVLQTCIGDGSFYRIVVCE